LGKAYGIKIGNFFILLQIMLIHVPYVLRYNCQSWRIRYRKGCQDRAWTSWRRVSLNTNRPQKEGDTMSFLYLLPFGLSKPDKPGWGSWGGRYGLNEEHPGKNYYWANQEDDWDGSLNRNNVLARWAEAFQNDFRVRMDWCVKPYEEANHHPVAIVNGSKETEIIQIRAKPGKVIKLDGGKSYDPDGRNLIPEWLYYREAGTCSKEISLTQKASMKISFVVPDTEQPGTSHIVFILKNDGDPALYSYRRILINIVP